MLVGTQKILGLVQDCLTDLVHILRVGMLTLGLSTEALLAEADAFGRVIDHILLDGLLAAVSHALLAEVVLRILGEKVLPSNLLDGGVEVGTVIQFLFAYLVIWVRLGRDHVGEG